MQGKSFLDGAWKGELVGGVGGAISGVGLTGAFSNWGMVGAGMAKGGITGFATGGLSSALNGTNVLKGSLTGLFAGAAIGGVTGALQRLGLGREDLLLQNDDKLTGEFFQSDAELDGFINKNIGDVSKIETALRTDISPDFINRTPKITQTALESTFALQFYPGA